MKDKGGKLKKVLKFTVVAICLSGFFLQTHEFLELYWTYPTVVDMQVSVPSEIDLPAISFCSVAGINPSVICEQEEFCIDSNKFEEENLCTSFEEVCENSKMVNKNFKVVTYDKYAKHANFNASLMMLLRKPVEKFFKCRIKSAGQTRDCDMSGIMLGSYFSDTNLYNFCYTMNGLWANPHRKIPRIKKSERIEMDFYINVSDAENVSIDDIVYPKYNYPSYPGVQLAIHSPYLSLSPYAVGSGFLGGKSYQIKLQQNEKHLLPAPYQTNCTDYMEIWEARGGIGPLNQMMVVDECKYNRSLIERGCVPFSIDYPHNKTVCKYCQGCDDLDHIRDECTKQLMDYNQPCDFINYGIEIEEKLVDLEKRLTSKHLRIDETIIQKRKGFDCTFHNIWTKPCQTVTIELVFDNFQITNLTYNPKFESIELFSVIGGYMGMYLGVSIVAVYDFSEILLTAAYQFLRKWRARKKKEKSDKRKAAKLYRERFHRSSAYGMTFNHMR